MPPVSVSSGLKPGIFPDEIVVRGIVPASPNGFQGATHQFVDLPANEEVFLARPGINGHRRLLRTVQGLQLVISEFDHDFLPFPHRTRGKNG